MSERHETNDPPQDQEEPGGTTAAVVGAAPAGHEPAGHEPVGREPVGHEPVGFGLAGGHGEGVTPGSGDHAAGPRPGEDRDRPGDWPGERRPGDRRRGVGAARGRGAARKGDAGSERDAGPGRGAAPTHGGARQDGTRQDGPPQGGVPRDGAGDARLRRQAAVALGLLGAVILAVAAFTTPWRALAEGAPDVAPDPSRDFSAAQIARSQAFDAATSLPGYLSLGLTVLFAALLVATPFGARAVGWLRGPWWARTVLGVLVLTAIAEVIRWPLGVWFETLLRDYGLSTQNWASWAGDRLKSAGINVVLMSVMVLAIVALARKVRRWWIPAAAGAFALTVGASFVYPVVFEPVFNDFTSMRAGALRANLLAMAQRDGVPVDDVLVADASRRTTALNAYVSGFGATRRIVVYDTLLKAPQREIELVVAHELGHAKYRDVLNGTLIGGLGAAFGAILLFLLFGALRRRAGITSIGDPRAVGLIIGLLGLAGLVSGPGENVISRHVEARADAHALDLTRDPAMFVAMQKRLATTNISDLSPDAVEYVLYVSHPSSPERIAMARAWAKLNGVPEP
ncbi:M48 family metalloprotease [Nonomuraea sp. NN258]|uniref:M48 family metalloprotease n=1 Tax=Nonomuraea antri TaxID=2730852 RepID=UPI001568F4E6|nr:M48 family metalloprotease [Nonomuraea antri]NRQ37824.1 M48 family metalloprotease [Nonomuraea antri]